MMSKYHTCSANYGLTSNLSLHIIYKSAHAVKAIIMPIFNLHRLSYRWQLHTQDETYIATHKHNATVSS